jgi:hypothetical protein
MTEDENIACVREDPSNRVITFKRADPLTEKQLAEIRAEAAGRGSSTVSACNAKRIAAAIAAGAKPSLSAKADDTHSQSAPKSSK